MSTKLICALMMLLGLAGCGFQPLYEAGGSSAAMQQRLSGVDVAPISDRLGQVMRNRLMERLNASGSPRHLLVVSLDPSSQVYGIRPDESAAQEQITLVATVQLIDLSTDEPAFEQTFRERASFDLVLSDFSNVMQREDTTRRLALELAGRIHTRLALFFSDLKE